MLRTRDDDATIEARRDMAAALRWAAKLGLSEGICNHFSLVVPGRDDRFLVNPQGLHWAEMTAGSLLEVDGDGRVVAGEGNVEPTALYIHWRVHVRHPRARCVLHTHMPWTTALTSLADPRLRMVNQNSLRFFGRVACDDAYNGLALDGAEGDRIAAALGDADVMMMGNHGVMVVGPSVALAFDDLYYLERAAQNQVLAMQTGRELAEVPTQMAQATARQMAADPAQAVAHLAALRRLLDREAPEYRAL